MKRRSTLPLTERTVASGGGTRSGVREPHAKSAASVTAESAR